MALAAGNRDTESSEDDVARDADQSRDAAPVAALVDERLTHVEEDGPYSHEATRSRSAFVVTFTSRGSPSTIVTRPPIASTSAAQSVAAPDSAA